MSQDFNSTGSLLEIILQKPKQRSQHIDEATRTVEERIKYLYGKGAEGNTRFEHLRQRLLAYGGYEAELRKATAMGLKDTINERNGFDLDLINQIFIVQFQDFDTMMGSEFHTVFDDTHINFLSEPAQRLRNEVVIYRNLSTMVNRGQRKLNGDYTAARKGKANEQFKEFRRMSKLVMVGLELLLAERYNLETEFRRFSDQPTYEQYQESLSSIEGLRDKIVKTSADIRATSIKSAAVYLMALCDHYASIINYQFLKNLKPDEVMSKEMNLRELQQTSMVLAGRYVNSRTAFPQQLSARLPPLDADITRFYQNGNVSTYFANLKKATSAPH